MRRLILAVMIVLLPLRGWIGDAMALEKARTREFNSQVGADDVEQPREAVRARNRAGGG